MKSFLSKIYAGNICVQKFRVEFISEIIGQSKKKCFIVVDDNSFYEFFDLNLSWDVHKTLLLPPKHLSLNMTPNGFRSYYEDSMKLFDIVADSLWDVVRGVIVSSENKGLYLPTKKNNSLVVDNSVDYMSLLAFLMDGGYRCVDVVSGCGDFAKRGAIIDMYPHTSPHPIRVTFFDKARVFLFDVNKQTTIKELSRVILPSLCEQNKKMLLDVSPKEWLIMSYKNNVLTVGDNVDMLPFPYKLLSYGDYIQKQTLYDERELLYDGSVAFVDKDKYLFVPPWFNKKMEHRDVNLGNNFLLTDFEVGDFLVHRDCGIGRFAGVACGDNDVGQEFIVMEYGDGRILVDVHSLYKISFYASSISVGVSVDLLGKRGRWLRRKNSVKNKLKLFVKELFDLYNTNSIVRVVPYVRDDDLESQFIKGFRYKETIDQVKVWEEVSNDLLSTKFMDRLLCGDVGFGKTEIALRSAFKVVSGGGRVLVLAPTTILTKQLYDSFRVRLGVFGVVVDFLSRLKTTKERGLVELGWIQSKIDVLVGTHALLYNDIYLQKSDLLIIDEEHKFGVKQKEKVRLHGRSVDVLSMSATPIPRTLSLAMSGFKSISTLSVAPDCRKPIITQVVWFNEAFIKNIILQEYSRGGQVYFVENNIQVLSAYSDLIVRLLPFLRVAIVHGKMNPVDIDKTMLSFVDKSVDVLVATSIIESGLDISNVNTIIINNAQKFGLSQLYQIRGRVGRSISQAFCYLMLPKGVDLNKSAFRRLSAIEKNTHLGAGYNISNMDLEIRGGGSVFGYAQSGGNNVGFELYSSLLNEEVGVVGEKYFYNVKFSSYLSGFIPEGYIENDFLRLSFYRRLNSVSSTTDIDNLKNEVENRFGEVPVSFLLLFDEFLIREVSAKLSLSSIIVSRYSLVVGFDGTFWGGLVDPLLEFVESFVVLNGLKYNYINKTSGCYVKLLYKGSKLLYRNVLDFLNNLEKII